MSDWTRERVQRLERRIASLKQTDRALEHAPFLRASNERAVVDMERKLVLFRLQQESCTPSVARGSTVLKQTSL